MSLVTVQEIRTYDQARVTDAVRSSLAPLGGIEAFVHPGQTVLLKPNLVTGAAQERAISTHPAVVLAVGRLVQEAGGKVWIGDSPGVGDAARAARKSGFLAVAAELGAEWIDFSEVRTFDEPANRVVRRLPLTRAVADADVIISLPKLKTHGQLTFTGAVKNQFGLVPGTRKARYHYRLRTAEWMARLMIDINRVAKPALAIMDAIIGMEGLGPSAGRPREIGALIAGCDLSAVDVVACRLIGLDPRLVPTLRAADEVGWGTTSLAEIEIIGDRFDALCLTDFEQVRQLVSVLRVVPLPSAILRWMHRQWQPRPRIDGDVCVHCGACAEGCPVEPPAIDPAATGGPSVNDATCIRCYCCHEFCPEKAIRLEPARFSWLFQPLERL